MSPDRPTVPTDHVERLVRAAAWAPSGDNTQPWQFSWDADRRALEIILDPARDASPLNAGQQMALIACGAALENVCRFAAGLGWEVTVEQLPHGPLIVPTPVARIVLGGRSEAGNAGEIEAAILARTSNRKPYDRRPLDPAVLSALQAASSDLPKARAHWITDRALLTRFADLIAKSDAVMFGEHEMRRAFLGNVRFDLAWDASPDLGLSMGSLEASFSDRLALRAMRVMPDRLFALSGGAKMLGSLSRKLVRSSSGLCVVVASGEARRATLDLGRAAQCVWLALTEQGLAAQPMMSLTGLGFALAHGGPELVRSVERLGAPAVLRDMEGLLSSAGISGAPGFLFRFGFAPPPKYRVGRLFRR